MFRRKGLAVLAACVAMACGAVVRAADLSTSVVASNQPIMADDSTPTRKPLMAALDKVGIAKGLDDLGINVGGYVEGSWTFDASHSDGYMNGRAFDTRNESILLNQVDLFVTRAVDATKGKFDVGFMIEQIYGADGAYIHSNGLTTYSPSKILGAYPNARGTGTRSPKNQYDLAQAFVQFAVPVGKGMTITAGKFFTSMGYEVVNPTLNAEYSRSFLFTQLPIAHTGVTVSQNLTDTLSVMGGVTRGWDESLDDVNGSLDAVGQIKYTMDKWTFFLNGITGNEQPDFAVGPNGGGLNGWRTVLDFIASYAYADNLTLAVNVDYGWESQVDAGGNGQWYGVAAYASYKLTDNGMFTLNGRGEWFNDPDGTAPFSYNAGTPNQYYEVTLNVAVKPFPNNTYGAGLVIRPEVRWDYADKGTWVGDNSHNRLTAAIEASYAF
jgi:hypothetical protein